MQDQEKQFALEIAVISLASSTERRKLVCERMKQCPVPWRIHDASNGEDNPLPYDPDRAMITYGARLTPNEIGCCVSHYRCIREFAFSESRFNYMLVLEDDVWVDFGFNFAGLPRVMSRLGMEYLKLYSRQIAGTIFLGRFGHRSFFRFTRPQWGNQAFVVSREGARRFVAAIPRIDRMIDDEMDRYWVNGLPTYALYPYPVVELNSPSTVPKGTAAGEKLSPKQKVLRILFRLQTKLRRTYANRLLRSRDRKIYQLLNQPDMPQL